MSQPAHSVRWTWTALAAYWVTLFVGTHLPPQQALPLPAMSDKVIHALAYGGLAVLLSLALSRRRQWRIALALSVLAVLGGYAAVDELLQIPVGRHGDVLDWVADMIGVLTALAAWSLWSRRRAAQEEGSR
jgi:VanZ family protein